MQYLLNGVILLDKPKGISSQQAVSAIKRIFNIRKAGHTGSLDVLATGLLPICLNEATKFSQFLLEKDKHYQVKARLGIRTSTLDAEGEILEQKLVPEFQYSDVEKVLERFRGTIQQIPPMFSALKHNGKPLYALARKGIEIDRAPRTITVFRLDLVEKNSQSLTLNVHCSKGTYIRSLVDEIGLALGCGAYVEMLRRTAAGPYQENQMVALETLQTVAKSAEPEHLLSFVQPIPSMFPDFPAITCTEEERIALQQGKTIVFENVLKTTLCKTRAEARDYNDLLALQQCKIINVGSAAVDVGLHPSSVVPLAAGFSMSSPNALRTNDCAYKDISNMILLDENQQFFGVAEWTADQQLKAKRLMSIQ